MFEVGDIVRGTKESDKYYGITNSRMTKGIVRSVDGESIEIRVLEHEYGSNGKFSVSEKYFEKIGHAEPFDRGKFLESLKESKAKAAEYLSDADLSDANLSGTKGLLDAINYLEANFERTKDGYIVYKTFGAYNAPPETWKIEKDSIIEEVCNPNRTNQCGCGINVATLDWVEKDNLYSDRKVYKLLIRFEWLPGVVVPYGTDGKIRCSRAQIIGEVE